MSDSDWVIKEFQRRRKDTWRSIKIYLILGLVGTVGGVVDDNLDNIDNVVNSILSGAFFILVFVSLIRIIFIVGKKYKCPSFRKVPISGALDLGPGSFGYKDGVDPNPIKCSNCGVRLK